MANRSHAAGPRRWSARVLGRIALLLLVSALMSYGALQLWRAKTDDLTVIGAERNGVAYLRPMVRLAGELTNAQSAAVRGGRVDTAAVDAAVSAVDVVDKTLGGRLGTSQRWSELRGQISAATQARAIGEAAYRSYTAVVVLAIDLCRKAGDTSTLILDPALDSYYLMDTAMLRIPDVLVAAGRAADLAALATDQSAESAQAQISVARYQVAAAGDAISSGLRKSIDATDSATLGPRVTGQLDAFRAAVDGFVPPVTLLHTLDKADPATLANAAQRVRDAAQPLADSVFAELDALLRARGEALSTQRLSATATTAAALLLVLVLLWLLLPPPRSAAPEEAVEGVGLEAGILAPAGTTIVDPHDLLAVEELLHVGRAVRARRRDRAGDAG
jgi:hypothetical protein